MYFANWLSRIIRESKLAKYINSPETEFYKKGNMIFNLDKAKDSRSKTSEVLIVEGYMDVVSVYSSGINNVIANSGTALTERQISLIWKFFSNPIICLAGDKKASLNKIKKELNIKDASMASADEVKDITGYTIGGVSPVGHLNKIKIFIDNSLKRFNSLFAAAGHPNCVFKINFNELQKITNGSIKEITE